VGESLWRSRLQPSPIITQEIDMTDISKDVEYLRSRSFFNRINDNNDALALLAAVFRLSIDKKGLNKDDFIYLVELYEKGYIRVVSNEKRDAMRIERCDPSDAPQLKSQLH
jgi:hypothetical protein